MADWGPFHYLSSVAIVLLVCFSIYLERRISTLEGQMTEVKQVTDQICFVDQSGYKVIRPCS